MERTPLIQRINGHCVKLSPELTENFVQLIRRGLPPDGVCDYLFVPHSTLWRWIKQGTHYLDGNNEPKSDQAYGHFVSQLRKALADYRLKLVDELNEDPRNSKYALRKWKRALAVLERRDPDNFGKRPDHNSDEDSAFDPDESFL